MYFGVNQCFICLSVAIDPGTTELVLILYFPYSCAQEYGKYNIRTNSVVPGSIATERQIKHWLTPKYKKLILDSQALKRQLKPNDVAQMVMFLASDQSSGCTKQSFIVDGGIT